jgi:enterochelin esterase-like enzyme
LLVLACVALPAAAPAAGGTAGAALDVSFHSAALDAEMHALVFLPAGYESGTTRYPAIYFLHGLPATATAYAGNKWLAASLAAGGKPAILVEPQGARASDSDGEYLNWGPGRNWETYVSGEVVNYIDAHFRTIASRQGRALVGLSAGGYGAVIVGIHHLDRFAAIESWSGYFHPTDPTGTVALDRGSDADAHAQIASLKAQESKLPTYLAFYVGRGDTRFLAENIQFARELTAAHVPHRFAVYPGGHTSTLWYAHAEGWLVTALRRLAPPSTDP